MAKYKIERGTDNEKTAKTGDLSVTSSDTCIRCDEKLIAGFNCPETRKVVICDLCYDELG